MAVQATAAPSHLLSPQRVDQLVREHYDPRDYPLYPQELIDEYEALNDQLEQELPARLQAIGATGSSPLEQSDQAVQRHHQWLNAHAARVHELEQQITTRLRQRKIFLNDLYRSLEPVAAERHRSPDFRYLSDQQWLRHVERAVAGIDRKDKRANVLAVAHALAEHARRDGVFLAGVVDVQDAHGIAHSTWTRAYTWLVEQGVTQTLSPRRLLTQLERALAIGSEDHANVFRWRAVIQLQHPTSTLHDVKWVNPPRSGVLRESLYMRVVSTDLRPVDNGAPRRTGAAPPLATTKGGRAWRQFHPATQTLYKLAVGLAERLTGYLPTNHPITVRLGAQMTPQRTALCYALQSASPVRLMPHLHRFARAGTDPAALLIAIEDAEYRSGREPHRRTWNPTRRLIAALRELDLDDISSA